MRKYIVTILATILASLLIAACTPEELDAWCKATNTNCKFNTTTTTISSTTTTTRPATTTTTVPSSSTYVFRDEFNGTSLDLTKWRPNWLAGSDTTITKGANGAEIACMDPANAVEPGDGYLHLKLQQRNCTASNGTTYPYAGALVQSRSDNKTFTFGTFEARIYTPPSSGPMVNWPGWWMDGDNWPTTGEIDVMEGLGGSACWHFHYSSGAPGGCSSIQGGWHTYKAVWTSTSITFVYDDVQVGKITSGVTSAPMYLILDYTADNSGIGGTVSAPQEMLVDWVRAS